MQLSQKLVFVLIHFHLKIYENSLIKIAAIVIDITLQQMKGSNESINQLNIDQIYAGINLNAGSLNNNETLKNNESQKPPHPISPKFYAEPQSNIKTRKPNKRKQKPVNLNYQISKVKTGMFVTLALIPIIWIGFVMGTCPSKYRNQQICGATAITYSSYYNQFFSYVAISESECCNPYKIVFAIWLGTFLAYILINLLVFMKRPSSMSSYFIGILLFSKVGQGGACCPNSCSAITLLIFWPIITILAIISGVIYLFTLCCCQKEPQQN